MHRAHETTHGHDFARRALRHGVYKLLAAAPVKIADSKPNGGLHPLGAGLVETIEAETTVRYARTFELCAGAPVGWKPLLGGDPC